MSPQSRESSGIYSWRIKSLKKFLENKVVFWTNSEKKLPCGSVADKRTKVKPENGILDTGSGNEIMEYVVPSSRCVPLPRSSSLITHLPCPSALSTLRHPSPTLIHTRKNRVTPMTRGIAFMYFKSMADFGSTRRRSDRCEKSISWRTGNGYWIPSNASHPHTRRLSRTWARSLHISRRAHGHGFEGREGVRGNILVLTHSEEMSVSLTVSDYVLLFLHEQDATEDGGDHYMTMEYQRKITNVVALAIDM